MARVASRCPILVMGPTASGKSALAMALAERIPAEIISVDSAQVYRGMDIGTAKPSLVDRARVAHHLIDVADPTEAWSVARFGAEALRLVAEVRARGRTPLLVGGTMLYFRALREGLSTLPAADAGTRRRLDAEAAAAGWPALHARLARVDPVLAARLEPTDSQRIQRALEVFELTGHRMSSLLERRPRDASLGPHVAIAIVPGDRAVLHRRIEQRFAAMLDAGLVDELRALRARWPLDAALPSMRTVGYRQAWDVLEGAIPFAELLPRGVAATRQLAKRQLTWLRRTRATHFDCLARDLHERVARWLGIPA